MPSAVAQADGSGQRGPGDDRADVDQEGRVPGTPGNNTEVPRETLVTALGQRMKPMCSTMDLQPGISHVEVAAPAFGDAPFSVVSNE